MKELQQHRAQAEDQAAKTRARRRARTLKHLIVFQVKLLLEGLKDLLLGPLSIAAASLDFIAATEAPDRYLDAVMRFGERYEKWLGLYEIGELPEADELPAVTQVHPPPQRDPSPHPPQIESTRVDSRR